MIINSTLCAETCYWLQPKKSGSLTLQKGMSAAANIQYIFIIPFKAESITNAALQLATQNFRFLKQSKYIMELYY